MQSLRKYFQNLFNNHLPGQKIRQEAYQEITRSLNKAFSLPSLRQYSRSLEVKGLLVKAVEMFVGSRAMPKNIGLSRQLIQLAQAKSKNEKEKDQIEYYKYFFLRIDAFKNGKSAEFDVSTEMLNRLAEEKGHPQSCYLVGKQLINVAQNIPNIEDRKKMIKLAAHYFQKSLSDSQYGGLYFLGEILRNSQYSEMTDKEVREFFVFGAAMGDPMCYFRMSQIHLAQGNNKLYLKYLKLAAQNGVIQAQHNLGCQYLDGIKVELDELKAFAWFLHAGANGFIESKYNTVYMFLNGSKCGRIKKNKTAALLKLQELKNMGEPVQDKITELVEGYQTREQIRSQKI